jgi:hypothetical protein
MDSSSTRSAAVALANKPARVIWAVWKNDRAFESQAA